MERLKSKLRQLLPDEVVDKVQQNIVEVNPEDVVKITNDAQRKDQSYELYPETVQKVAKELFTEM